MILRNSNKQILEDYQWTILEQKTIHNFTIAESPLDENVIWVGTDDGNVQVTKDGGKNWQNVVSNIQGLPSNTWTYHIEASVHGKGTAYAVFDGHNSGDMQPYVYKTSDFGTTWTNIITDNVIGTSRNIQEDYENENLLFLRNRIWTLYYC